MSKYYNEELKEKKQITSSELYNEKSSKRTSDIINYLVSILGNVELSEEMLKTFVNQFDRYLGKYSVMIEPDTIIGMYNIVSTREDLSPVAINELWPKYIKDLFEENNLVQKLNDIEKIMGKTDDAFKVYTIYIDQKAEELDEKYQKDAERLEELDNYSNRFVARLRTLITRKHISYDRLVECIPEASLIDDDEKYLKELSTYHRIGLGAGAPISHEMVECLAKKGSLDDFNEQPTYYVDVANKKYPSLFTKQDFINSIEERNNKKEYVKKED